MSEESIAYLYDELQRLEEAVDKINPCDDRAERIEQHLNDLAEYVREELRDLGEEV